MKKDFSSFSEAVLLELSGESSDGLVTKGRFAGSFLLGLEIVELSFSLFKFLLFVQFLLLLFIVFLEFLLFC